ncbi:MAG: ATPase, T2SS/T4P/T4SS family, partial [Planctomycetales bacterium]
KSKGMFLVCSLPSNGLTTTVNAALRATDFHSREWVAVEEKNQVETEIAEIKVETYDAEMGQSPATALPGLIRGYPDAYLVRNLVNAETLRILLGKDIAGEGKIMISSVPAKEAAEAPLRILMLKDAKGQAVPPAEFAPHLLGVLNVRLIRKLCVDCRQPFEVTPQYLQQLGLQPGSVQQLYRHGTPVSDRPKDICQTCGGRGFAGRTGLFELTVYNDRLRQVLAQTPRVENLRAESLQAGCANLQHEGIRLVVAGITSLEELQRVLQQ